MQVENEVIHLVKVDICMEYREKGRQKIHYRGTTKLILNALGLYLMPLIKN